MQIIHLAFLQWLYLDWKFLYYYMQMLVFNTFLMIFFFFTFTCAHSEWLFSDGFVVFYFDLFVLALRLNLQSLSPFPVSDI